MEIKIENLEKEYKRGTRALKGVNLVIESGLFGLLGPNGAGKSTLMKILVTLMEPTKGKVFINGMDLMKNRAEIRKMIGYLPQHFNSFPKLKAWEFLDYSARLADIKKSSNRKEAIEKTLEMVGLYDARNRYANKLSGGMKRRLGIAQALIGEPEILVIDEPTTGLDPMERLRFRNLLAKMSQNDIIIILSTHIVGDISSSCSSMALLNRGEMVYSDTPESLIKEAIGNVWQIRANDRELNSIKEQYPVISTVPSDNGWEVQVVGSEMTQFDGEPIEPDLEHAYVYFLKSHLGEFWIDNINMEEIITPN